MNQVMTLAQLERLVKNPSYTLSEKQLAELEEHRKNKYLKFRHPVALNKHQPKVEKHETELEET